MSKIKQFFRQSGLTKAQLISSLLCYFLCFALFLGIVVIWNPLSLSSTPTEDSQAADGPTNTSGYWTDTGRYDISWYNNPDTETYGDGSAEKPYKISTAAQLAGLSYLVYNNAVESSDVTTSGSANYIFSDKYFEQTAKIDISAYYWQPIGIRYDRSGTRVGRYFSGNYDGGGHTVSGVFTPDGSGDAYSYQGLFGYVYPSDSANPVSIQNLGVIDSLIQGDSYLGGVVGYAYAPSSSSSGTITITNCYNTGSVTGFNDVGGLVGYSVGTTTVTNCYNTGSVTSSGGSDVGGLVGYSSSSTISNCYNTGVVTGGNRVGGLLGTTYSGTIANCYNTGSVTGSSDRVGGLIVNLGGVSSSSIYMYSCFNIGNVSSSYASTIIPPSIGGLIGEVSSGTVRISNNYNFGSITYSDPSAITVGGIIGQISSTGDPVISNNFYGANCDSTLGGINGADTDGQAKYSSALTVDTPKDISWYTTSSNWHTSYSWNFDENWQISSSVNDGYPVLYYQEVPIDWWTNEGNYSIEWFTSSDKTTYGDGSASNPYIIDSAEDLAGLSWLVYTRGQEDNPLVEGTDYTINGTSTFCVFDNKHFIQSENIDLSAHVWQPIGIYYTRDGTSRANIFSGSYDGGGHTVSGINTPAGDTDAYSYQGLFGYIDSSFDNPMTIQNIGITNSSIQGYRNVGGVVGYAQSTNITNCNNTGSVSGSEYIGGIVGYLSGDGLNCSNSGNVIGNAYVGGISGCGTDIKCYNIGKVRGSSSVGGIVGSGTAKYCYNQGEVSGTTYVGGIVGGNAQDSSFASRCYNTGIITGDDYVAGIVGCSHFVDKTYDPYDVIAYNINIGQIQGVTNVGQIASACERTELIKNYFNTGSSADTVDGATYDSNAENYLYDEAWLYENLFWDIGFTYKISQDAYPTFRTEEEKNSWLNESLVEINTNWEGLGTIDEPYKISSAEDLAGLAVAVNTGMIGDEALEYSNVQTPLGIQAQVYFQGIYFEQTADIDLSSHYWEGIGQMDANFENFIAFGGNYNGNNYKISGLKTVENINTYQSNSLFISIIGTSTQKAEIKNINFDKTNFVASPTIFNGILAGMSIDAQINNCKFEGNIFIPHEYAEPYIFGGAVGSYAVDSIVSDCINYCDIYSEFSADAISGIVGMLASFSLEGNAKIENCVNYGNFSGAGNMYGICYAVMMGEISGCKNYGNMTSSDIKMSPDRSDELVCGIVGTVENGQIKNCENYGKLTTYHSEATDEILYIAGIAYSISSSSLTNCNNYGEVVVANPNESSQIIPSGIVGSMQQSTVDSCNNYGLVNGVYSSGIVSCVNGVSTIINCNNFGSIKATYGSAGIAFLIANGTTIENCGSFGNLETTAEGGMNMGIAYTPVQDSTVDTDQYFIRNCLVDVKVIFNQDQTLFGGIMGMAYGESSATNVSPYIDSCFVKAELSLPEVVTMTSIDVIDAINGMDPDSSFTADINCYGVITGNGIPTIKHISGLTTEMEGNFVYLDGFYDDMPVPIKTDGTNFFHMHDFGLTTGILDQINEVFYPNLAAQPITFETTYWDFSESEAPPFEQIVSQNLTLGLSAGKTYNIEMTIDGTSVSTTATASWQDSAAAPSSAISFGDGLNLTVNGVSYFFMILENATLNDAGAFVYTPGQTILFAYGYTNNTVEGATISPSVPVVITAIREVA